MSNVQKLSSNNDQHRWNPLPLRWNPVRKGGRNKETSKRTFLREGKVVNHKTIDKMTTAIQDRGRRRAVDSALRDAFGTRG